MQFRRIFLLALSFMSVCLTARAVTLQSVFDGTGGNTMNLSGATTYTGGVTITRNMTINGNGALLTLNKAAFERIIVPGGVTVSISNLRVQGGFSVVKFESGASGTLTNVSASGQDVSIEHAGGGSLTVQSCQFHDLTDRALLVFGPTGSLATTVTLRNMEVVNAQYGVQFEGGVDLLMQNCYFQNTTQGVWTSTAKLGTAGNRAQINGCTFVGGNTGILLQANSFTDVSGTALFGFRYPVQIHGGADVNMNSVAVFQNGVSSPSVGVAVDTGAVVRAKNCQVTGYINSFDMSVNATLEADGCTMTHPQFSGIICKQNSVANVRNCTFIDNGQDSLFYGTDPPSGTDTSHGVIENNYSTNAGADGDFGTGIALVSSGSFTLRNNAVLGSLDVGIAVKNGASAIIDGNQIVASKKGGIILQGAGNVTVRDNTIAAHTANGQAGLIVDDSNGSVVVQRNILAGNSFGIQFRGAASSTDFQYNFVTRSIKQGVSVTEGRMTSIRSAFVDNNADWQVFVTSSLQSNFTDSLFTATGTKKGVYTERGACSSSASNKTVATGSWWNLSTGPQNRCSGSSPDARMEYQNADVGSPRSSPHLDVVLTGSLNGAGVSTRVPASGGALLPAIGLPGGLPNNAFVGVFRPSADFSESAPPGTASLPPVYLWTTPAVTQSPGSVTLQFASGAQLFGHYNRTTSAFDDLFVTDLAFGTATVTIPAARLQNGTWYFLDDSATPSVLDLLLGTRGSLGILPGLDLRIDAADL